MGCSNGLLFGPSEKIEFGKWTTAVNLAKCHGAPATAVRTFYDDTGPYLFHKNYCFVYLYQKILLFDSHHRFGMNNFQLNCSSAWSTNTFIGVQQNRRCRRNHVVAGLASMTKSGIIINWKVFCRLSSTAQGERQDPPIATVTEYCGLGGGSGNTLRDEEVVEDVGVVGSSTSSSTTLQISGTTFY